MTALRAAGYWDTQSGTPATPPGNGKYQADNWTTPTLLAVSVIDKDGYTRTLASVLPGDTLIQLASNDSQNYIAMAVVSLTDNGTWAQIGVQVQDTGTAFTAPGSNQTRLLEILRETPPGAGTGPPPAGEGAASRFADAVTALVAAYQAAPGLAGVPVADGVVPSGAASADFIIVGHDAAMAADGVLAAAATAGAFTQDWADTTTGRDERGAVNCLIACQGPDPGDVAGRRARATVLLAAADAAAATAVAAHLTFDGTDSGRFLYRQGAAGLAVICAYRVTYSAPWG